MVKIYHKENERVKSEWSACLCETVCQTSTWKKSLPHYSYFQKGFFAFPVLCFSPANVLEYVSEDPRY